MVEQPKKRSEILQEQINELQKEMKELESLKTSTHSHTSKDVFDCPECGETYLNEARKRLEPEFKEKFAPKSPEKKKIEKVKCSWCGQEVDKEAEECEYCGNDEYYEESDE